MKKHSAFLLFLIIILVWGVNWTVTKLIVQSMQPIWSNAVRCLIAAIALLALQLVTRQCMMPARRDVPAILVVSVFHMTIFATLMAVGLQYISVGRSVVLGYTTPLWVTPAAIVLLREPVNAWRIAGVLLGIVGVGMLFAPSIMGMDMDSAESLWGHALLLVASLSWAVTIVGIKYVRWYSTPFQLVFWQLLLATLLSAVCAWLMEGELQVAWSSALGWQLAYSGLAATAFGFWGMTVINKHLPAIITSLGLLATPIVGMMFSQYMLGEALDSVLLMAGSLIFIGIALGLKEGKK